MTPNQSTLTPRAALPTTTPVVVRILLYALAVLMPMESISMGPLSGQITPTSLIAYLLFPVSLFTYRACFGKVPRALWLFGIYTALYWIEGIMVPGSMWSYVFGYGFTVLQMIPFFWILTNVLKDDKLSNGVVYAFALGCLGLVICQYLHVQGTGDAAIAEKTMKQGRDTVLGEDPIKTAQSYSLGLLCCIGILVGKWKWWQKATVVPVIPVVLFYMLLLGARGAVLALVVGAAVFLLAGKNLVQKSIVIFIVMSIIGGVVFISSMNKTLNTRWNLAIHGDFAKREVLLPIEVEMVAERPLFGWGPERNLVELGHRTGRNRFDMHNMYMWVATEVGLVGFAPLMMGLALCLVGGWAARNGNSGYLPLALMVALLVSNCSISTLHRKSFWLVSAYALATGSVMLPSDRQQRSVSQIADVGRNAQSLEG